jgi:putative membrane protein
MEQSVQFFICPYFLRFAATVRGISIADSNLQLTSYFYKLFMNKQLNQMIPQLKTPFLPALLALALTTALTLGTSLARAQNDMQSGSQTNGMTGAATTLTMADQKFMTNAAEGGMLEVKLGELAAQKATRDDVKNFGQKMVTDHTQINNDLTTLASQKGVPLPDMLDAKHQKIYEKLAALSGTDFDNDYISTMIKAHKMDAKLFKKESKTSDTDVKSFVDKSLTVIEEHLKMIEAISKSSPSM